MRVKGCYYGNVFTGTVVHREPSWVNGSFKKSEGVHLSVLLDIPFDHYGLRKSLWIHSWVNKKQFPWGHCEVVKCEAK